MRKLKKLLILTLSLIIFIIGCSSATNNSFQKMTQEAKKEHVINHLWEYHGLDCVIENDIKKRQINSFSSEDDYFAIAKLENEDRIHCWIDNSGNVSDSVFIYENQDEIYKVFFEEISKLTNEFELDVYTTLKNRPTKEWSKDDLREMLENENVETSVSLILENGVSYNIDEIVEKLSFTDGILYVYYVDDLDNIDVDNHDYKTYDKSIMFSKEQ